jgi:ABC-type proline/glycine betaine transport system permease subunit
MGELTRRQREKRAYTLTLVTGGAAVAAVVLFALAVVTSVGMGPAFLALVIAAIAGFVLRGTLRP